MLRNVSINIIFVTVITVQIVKGGVNMADNSIFMRVDEVAKVLDVSESYAYKIIKKLNKELAEKGKIVVSGRVNRKYFYKRIDCTDKTEGG